MNDKLERPFHSLHFNCIED